MKDTKAEKKKTLLPLIAASFTELGYRRATTSALAARCKVKEAILYRLWPDKKAMFLDSLDFIAENLLTVWKKQLSTTAEKKTGLEVLLSYESEHFAELNSYHIIFSGLTEASDPDIKASLQRMYFRIHTFLVEYITRYKIETEQPQGLDTTILAWALMSIGTMATITKHLGILTEQQRGQLLEDASKALLTSKS
jgi:AcrR family transcriptional regulator